MQHYKLMMQVLTKRHSGHIESFKKALKTHSENVQQRQKRVGERCENKRSFFYIDTNRTYIICIFLYIYRLWGWTCSIYSNRIIRSNNTIETVVLLGPQLCF